MEDNKQLRSIAENFKNNIESPTETPNDNITVDNDDDEAVIFMPKSDVTESLEGDTKVTVISPEKMREFMPDLDDNAFKAQSSAVMIEIEKYKKDLIMSAGLTPEEADRAALKRMENKGREINEKYLKDNPRLGIIEIDKKDEDKLEFSEEEKSKIAKAKAIRLIVVENQDLESIKIDKVSKEEKIKYLREIEGSLSHYSVPLPGIGDYVTFTGAPSVNLISLTQHEDDKLDEDLERKASLIYDRLSHGTILTKYNNSGNVSMSYDEFVNKFKYHDMELALYGIIVASSMEYSEYEFTCGNCNEPFKYTYNMKSLLRQEGITEFFKDRIEKILANRNNDKVLMELSSETDKKIRCKSPVTNNIYDFEYPSIAKVVNMFRSIDQTDNTEIYFATLCLCLNAILIYNPNTNSYIEMDSTELLSTIRTLPQADIDIITLQIQDMVYSPTFELNLKCPKCGQNMTNRLSIDNLVFLRAHDTLIVTA